MSEKIQKILANAGVASRRQIESWIQEGRISVNGEIATIGDRMTYHDRVCVDGREVKLLKSQHQKTRVLLYYKPEGEMCTRNDPENRPTIFERLPLIRNNRWVCVGRLDFNTAGLLIITNDGDLANKLMHPRANLEREYAVRTHGIVQPENLNYLKKGVMLDDGMAKFEKIEDAGGTGNNHWYHVIVKEGRNRLVRRLFETQHIEVTRLIRIRFGEVVLPSVLRRGRHLELTEEEVARLIATLRQNKN